MNDLLDQIEASLASKQYYLSLMVALTVPDMAGALHAVDGRATGQRYAAWFENWVHPELNETVQSLLPDGLKNIGITVHNPLSGEDCYRFRCSLLHQGTTQHPRSAYSRILFIEPGTVTSTVHYSIANDALCIDLPSFCNEVLRGARKWLASVSGTEPYESNRERFVRRHPSGLSPYIGGVPVVG